MIKGIQSYFDTRIRQASGVTSQEVTEPALRLATATLLIEITRADKEIKDAEREIVLRAVQKTFDLTDDQTDELVSLAEEEAREATSLYQFTYLINKGFTYEQKRHVVELLWSVVFADAEMEKHEEYLVRKIAGLLHVSHKDFIEAKQKARKACSQ